MPKGNPKPKACIVKRVDGRIHALFTIKSEEYFGGFHTTEHSAFEKIDALCDQFRVARIDHGDVKQEIERKRKLPSPKKKRKRRKVENSSDDNSSEEGETSGSEESGSEEESSSEEESGSGSEESSSEEESSEEESEEKFICMGCGEQGNMKSFIFCAHEGTPPHGGHYTCLGLTCIPRGQKWFCDLHSKSKKNFLGVSFKGSQTRGDWYATLRYHGMCFDIGPFESAEEAAKAFDQKMRKLAGEEYWKQNFPKEDDKENKENEPQKDAPIQCLEVVKEGPSRCHGFLQAKNGWFFFPSLRFRQPDFMKKPK